VGTFGRANTTPSPNLLVRTHLSDGCEAGIVESVVHECASFGAPMTQYLDVHAENPQRRLIRRAADALRAGGLIAYPTDSCYALGCRIGNKDALDRLRQIRQVDEHHHFTLVCSGLSEVARYASVDNVQYRLLRMTTPGSYTFILRSNRDVPKRIVNARRKTIGVRVPAHPVVSALLEELGEPILSSTLILPGEELPARDVDEIRDELRNQVDLVVASGSCGVEMTTVVDLTGEAPSIVRVGKGPLQPFGLGGAG
jgi:tRNA threonylcarbamoyl adenosine modification protein (Sua5/YciO/YrdC/YwlC family)